MKFTVIYDSKSEVENLENDVVKIEMSYNEWLDIKERIFKLDKNLWAEIDYQFKNNAKTEWTK